MSRLKEQMNHLLIEQSLDTQLQKKRLLIVNKLLEKLPSTAELFTTNYKIDKNATNKEKVRTLFLKTSLEKKKEYVRRKFSEKYFENHQSDDKETDIRNPNMSLSNMSEKQKDKVDSLKKSLLENVRKRKEIKRLKEVIKQKKKDNLDKSHSCDNTSETIDNNRNIKEFIST